jgi:hypothetical protein
MAAAMGQDRVDQAIGRIERALDRLEASAVRAPPLRDMGDDREVAELRRAHHALRGKVESAVAQIDRLLSAEAR